MNLPTKQLDPKSAKVELFCLELLQNGFNATEAYRVVISPKAKNPKSKASQFFLSAPVRKRLSELVSEKMREKGASLDRVIEELANIAFFNPDDFADLSGDRPTLDLQKLMQHPGAMRATRLKFNRVVDKDGGHHDVYEIQQQDKLAALQALLKYHQVDNDSAEERSRPIQINVNFPVPGSQWQRNTPAQDDVIDVDSSDGE